jgi:hypothetical protein
MALSLLTSGALAGIADVNQYYNLLTGVTTDQATVLNYRPGSGTTPTLKLDGDGHGPLIKGLKTDHSTTAFSIDSNGNLTLAGGLTVVGALSGVTTLAASGAVTLSSTLAVTTSITRGGNTVWDAGNDGSGSGLDADKLDGSHASAFATLSGATFTGGITGTTGTFSGVMKASTYEGPSGVAASFMVYDNAVGTLRAIRIFIGTTDPSTYTTVNEGDIWIKA